MLKYVNSVNTVVNLQYLGVLKNCKFLILKVKIMNNICPNINYAKNVSFSGLFSKKKNDVFVLQYGRSSVLSGESRVAIPEDSVISFRDTFNIDLTTKEMKSKIKNLRKNDSIIIGRNDINPGDTDISRKQFELKKIDKQLYICNLSQFGTEFTLLRTAPAVRTYPKPANIVQRQPLVNYNPNYLKARYGQPNLDFRMLFEQKYDDIRIAKYSDASTFVGNDIQTAVNTQPKNGFVWSERGWKFRHFNNGFTKPENRISLNVKADANLIRELDELFISGRYTDAYGRRCVVPKDKFVPGCYKTYADVKQWTCRHDPITMYFSKHMTPEFLNAVSDVAQKYARPSCNGIPLVGEVAGKPWISTEKEPCEDDLRPMLEKAQRIKPSLVDTIKHTCYKHWDYRNGFRDFFVSAGKFEAIKIVLDEYNAYLRLGR